MSLLIFIIGLLICIFAHPRVRSFIMARLFNEGLVTPRIVKLKEAELVKFAGPNLSLFGIGFVLMLLSLILKQSSQ